MNQVPREGSVAAAFHTPPPPRTLASTPPGPSARAPNTTSPKGSETPADALRSAGSHHGALNSGRRPTTAMRAPTRSRLLKPSASGTAVSAAISPPVGTKAAAPDTTTTGSHCPRSRARRAASTIQGSRPIAHNSAQCPISRRAATYADHMYSDAAGSCRVSPGPASRPAPQPARVSDASSTVFCSTCPGSGPASSATIASCGTDRGRPPPIPSIQGSSDCRGTNTMSRCRT